MAEVSIRDAADALGVSVDTIRRRIKTGELPATKGPRPSDPYTVTIPDDAAERVRTAREPGDGGEGDRAALRELVDVLREQVAVKDREITELHVLLQQAHRLLPMAPAAGGVEPESGDQVRRGRRRPWWRRILGE